MSVTRRDLLASAALLPLQRLLPNPKINLQPSNGMGVYSLPVVSSLPNCQYIQIHLQWNQVGWESHNWQTTDALLNPLIAQGYKLVLMVTGSPGMSAGCSERNLLDASGACNAVWLQQFEVFIRAALARYRGQWWTWEEESDDWYDRRNHSGVLIGCWGGKASEYLKVLQIMARARAEIDPTAKLLLSPVARENWAPPDQRPSFDMDFLANFAALGGLDLADYWGCNYYAPGFYLHHGNGPHSIIAKLQKARDSLPAQYRNKSLFVDTGHVSASEFGFKPADYVKQVSAHLWAASFLHGLNVIAHTHFIWQPKNDGDIEWGLTNPDGSMCPAGKAISWLNRRIPQKPIGARWLNCPGKEGYVFTLPDGSEKFISWTSCADMNNDGIISASDIQAVAGNWHERGDCLKHDLDGDRVVSVLDIQEVAKRFGEEC